MVAMRSDNLAILRAINNNNDDNKKKINLYYHAKRLQTEQQLYHRHTHLLNEILLMTNIYEAFGL